MPELLLGSRVNWDDFAVVNILLATEGEKVVLRERVRQIGIKNRDRFLPGEKAKKILRKRRLALEKEMRACEGIAKILAGK